HSTRQQQECPTHRETKRLPPQGPDTEQYQSALVLGKALPAERCPLWAKSGHCHSYSITSSAVASTFGGMVRPSALAVFRLMINSYLVDCTTGRSPGFSPLRMRPTETPTWR